MAGKLMYSVSSLIVFTNKVSQASMWSERVQRGVRDYSQTLDPDKKSNPEHMEKQKQIASMDSPEGNNVSTTWYPSTVNHLYF